MRGLGSISKAGSPPMAVQVSVTVCLIPEAKGGPFVLWDDLPGSIGQAAALGYDAVELFPPEPDALAPQTVKDLLAPHKLKVSAVGSGAGWVRHKLSLTHPDPAHREKARAFIRSMIDFAAALSAPVIIGSMQGRWGEGVPVSHVTCWCRPSLAAKSSRSRRRTARSPSRPCRRRPPRMARK